MTFCAMASGSIFFRFFDISTAPCCNISHVNVPAMSVAGFIKGSQGKIFKGGEIILFPEINFLQTFVATNVFRRPFNIFLSVNQYDDPFR